MYKEAIASSEVVVGRRGGGGVGVGVDVCLDDTGQESVE